MRVLIIEDEILAQAKLEAMLLALDKSIQIENKLSSVKDSVLWLSKNAAPDVAFVDIQLSDDHSFEIFKKVNIQFPVIFTTAYDKYLLDSFEYNSIDYLLKPITEEKLKRSLAKLKRLERHFIKGNLEKILQDVSRPATIERLIVRKGTEFVTLDVSDVAYFFTEHRIVFVRDFSGRQLIVDKNLGELELSLSKSFFRINRKYIANIRAIEKFKPDNGKIRIHLKPDVKDEEVHVSKETAPDFRKWIGGS
jgi:DNA-binding LytR/AlgR family response regulator